MTCRELVELVTEYLEGALPARQRARFEEHVAMCAGCRAYLAQMRRTVELTGRLQDDDVPEDLVAAFRGWAAANHPGDPGQTR